MTGTTYFAGHCRDCDRKIVIQLPATISFSTANGIRGRCAECGRTEWLQKASDVDIGADND